MTRTQQMLSLLAALAIAATTTGCNTIEGAGRDIAVAGDTVSETARDTRPPPPPPPRPPPPPPPPRI
jgi:predicted small secreted protein